jgi:Uma2 family endonuclease
MRPAGVKLTYDDFVLFPDDGMRHELVNGEHCVTASPSRKHQSIAWNLNRMIGVYLENQRVGRAFQAPFDVVLTPFDVVERGDMLTTPLMPGLELPLAKIFED